MQNVYFLQPRGEYSHSSLDTERGTLKEIEWRAAEYDKDFTVVYRTEITKLPLNTYNYSFHLYIGKDEAQALKKLRMLRLEYTPESIKKAYPEDTTLAKYMLDETGCEGADLEVSEDTIHFDYDLCDGDKVAHLNSIRDSRAYWFARKAYHILTDLSDIYLDPNKLEKRLWANPVTWITFAIATGAAITVAVLLNKKDVNVKQIEQASRNMAKQITFTSSNKKFNTSVLERELKTAKEQLAVAQKELTEALTSSTYYSQNYISNHRARIKSLTKKIEELVKKIADASK